MEKSFVVGIFAIVGSIAVCLVLVKNIANIENNALWNHNHNDNGYETSRRLQFEGMFEINPQAVRANKRLKGHKGGVGGGAGNGGGVGGGRGPNNQKRVNRPTALINYVDEVSLGQDRYHLWWTGPPDENKFKPESWGNQHSEYQNAIFTMAFVQGGADKSYASDLNAFHLFLGSARRVFDGDIVIAVESGISDEIKSALIKYRAVVYTIPNALCSRETSSIFCGSADERVPASVFRYFFYEKWSIAYSTASNILLADFRDVIFQADPFTYRRYEWASDYQLVLFQEFFPNMVIDRCSFNKRIVLECYGPEVLRFMGSKVIISSGVAMGYRDAILAWSHHMTVQLQDAPGRLTDTRCMSGGIDHAFTNWLLYSNKLKSLLRIKLFHQGEGPTNSVGGLRPDTVQANLTGTLRDYWHLLSPDGRVLNWNGDVSPVVHQIDHFVDELQTMVPAGVSPVDNVWQALHATKCLWGCNAASP